LVTLLEFVPLGAAANPGIDMRTAITAEIEILKSFAFTMNPPCHGTL
jgi:hypothetical protein